MFNPSSLPILSLSGVHQKRCTPTPCTLLALNTPLPTFKTMKKREFLNHLEIYLAKRDGVDKLLKLSKYASKIIIASSVIDETQLLSRRLKSFESSVDVSQQAFRLGKCVPGLQFVNALRNASFDSNVEQILSIIMYGSEGLFFFVEPFIWLTKLGLIDTRHLAMLQKISAWAEFIGYFGCVGLNSRDLKGIIEADRRLKSSIEIAALKGNRCEKEMNKLREKKLMKKLSIVQDFADGLMAFSDIRDGKGMISNPLLLASAGLLSALIGIHKNWLSC